MATGWFVAIAALWAGYFLLEGFDFGVGALLRVLGRDDAGRRTVLATIGPVWDGNEVWLITAIGATFAAFPAWYAGLLSTFYLPVLLILVALVLRAVAIEWRNKSAALARPWWDTAIVGCSLAIPALWGWVFGGVLGGLVAVAMTLLHGARFLVLKTSGELRERALRLARLLLVAVLPVVAAAFVGLGAWPLLALLPLVVAPSRDGWAFAATSALVVALVAAVFWRMHPNVLPGLTVAEAAAAEYPLFVLTVAAALIAPFVLAYQAWSYWVFRQRLG